MTDAATAFDAALACWTGDPLSDMSDFSFYDMPARCLHEFQLEIVERRNEAYLRCGRQLDMLRDIEAWIAMEPWRERLRGHHMLALYCAGRQIEALAVYTDLRDLLVTNFGVEPSEEIRQLHGNILRQEPQLLATLADLQELYQVAGPTSATSSNDRPDTESLLSQLRQIANDDIVVVDGGPDINKTWLVIEVSDSALDNRHNLTDDTGNAMTTHDARRLARRHPQPTVKRHSRRYRTARAESRPLLAGATGRRLTSQLNPTPDAASGPLATICRYEATASTAVGSHASAASAEMVVTPRKSTTARLTELVGHEVEYPREQLGSGDVERSSAAG